MEQTIVNVNYGAIYHIDSSTIQPNTYAMEGTVDEGDRWTRLNTHSTTTCG
jgi:hypothetical protein